MTAEIITAIPSIRPIVGDALNRYELDALLVARDSRGELVAVPPTFWSDLASVPAWAMLIAGKPTTSIQIAAIIHDWLYYAGRMSRRSADRVFKEIMVYLNVGAWQRNVYWLGVRMGGFDSWGRHRISEIVEPVEDKDRRKRLMAQSDELVEIYKEDA